MGGGFMTAEEMWAEFAKENHMGDVGYEAWAYGGDADGLARLTLEGAKTATSSAYPLYALDQEPLPEAGEYSVVLDSRGEAVCVIRTERVEVAPFRDVGEGHARREGEGDLTLAYWRRVHRRLFTDWMAEAGLAFSPDMPVVCEEFQLVWPE